MDCSGEIIKDRGIYLVKDNIIMQIKIVTDIVILNKVWVLLN